MCVIIIIISISLKDYRLFFFKLFYLSCYLLKIIYVIKIHYIYCILKLKTRFNSIEKTQKLHIKIV